MVSCNTNNAKLRDSWKRVLLFSLTLLRLMAVPAAASTLRASTIPELGCEHNPLQDLEISSVGAVCDRAQSGNSESFELSNWRGHRPRLQRAKSECLELLCNTPHNQHAEQSR